MLIKRIIEEMEKWIENYNKDRNMGDRIDINKEDLQELSITIYNAITYKETKEIKIRIDFQKWWKEEGEKLFRKWCNYKYYRQIKKQ